MRMNHQDWLINFPLAVLWMGSGYWLKALETGSWFFGLLLPYVGFAAASLQLYLILRKFWRY